MTKAEENQKAIKWLVELQEDPDAAFFIDPKAIDLAIQALQQPKISEERIWNILSTVHGCKPNKEDCSFKLCHHWAICDILTKAILKEIEG